MNLALFGRGQGRVELRDVVLLTAPLSQVSFDLISLIGQLDPQHSEGDQIRQSLWRIAAYVVKCVDAAVGPPPIPDVPSSCLLRMLELATEVFTMINDRRWIPRLEGCATVAMDFPVLLCAFAAAHSPRIFENKGRPSAKLSLAMQGFVDLALLLFPSFQFPILQFLVFARRTVSHHPNCFRLHAAAGSIDPGILADFLPCQEETKNPPTPPAASGKRRRKKGVQGSAVKEPSPLQAESPAALPAQALTSWVLSALCEAVLSTECQAMVLACINSDPKFISVIGSDAVCAEKVMSIYGDALLRRLSPRALAACCDVGTLEFLIELVDRAAAPKKWMAELFAHPDVRPFSSNKFQHCLKRCVELAADASFASSFSTGLLTVAAALLRVAPWEAVDGSAVLRGIAAQLLDLLLHVHCRCTISALSACGSEALDCVRNEIGHRRAPNLEALSLAPALELLSHILACVQPQPQHSHGTQKKKKGKGAAAGAQPSVRTVVPSDLDDAVRFVTALLAFLDACVGPRHSSCCEVFAAGEWRSFLHSVAWHTAAIGGDYAPRHAGDFIRIALRRGAIQYVHLFSMREEEVVLVDALVKRRDLRLLSVVLDAAQRQPDLVPGRVVREVLSLLRDAPSDFPKATSLAVAILAALSSQTAFADVIASESEKESMDWLFSDSFDRTIERATADVASTPTGCSSNLQSSLELLRAVVKMIVERAQHQHQQHLSAAAEATTKALRKKWQEEEQKQQQKVAEDRARRVQQIEDQQKQMRLNECLMARRVREENQRILEATNRRELGAARMRNAALQATERERIRRNNLISNFRTSSDREKRVAEIRKTLVDLGVPASQVHTVVLKFRRRANISIQQVLDFVVAGEVEEEPESGAAENSQAPVSEKISWFSDDPADDDNFWEACIAEARLQNPSPGPRPAVSPAASSMSQAINPTATFHQRVAILLDLFDFSCTGPEEVAPISLVAVRCTIPLDELRRYCWDDVDHVVFAAEQKKLVCHRNHFLELTLLGFRYHVEQWNPRRSFSAICQERAAQLHQLLAERKESMHDGPDEGEAAEPLWLDEIDLD